MGTCGALRRRLGRAVNRTLPVTKRKTARSTSAGNRMDMSLRGVRYELSNDFEMNMRYGSVGDASRQAPRCAWLDGRGGRPHMNSAAVPVRTLQLSPRENQDHPWGTWVRAWRFQRM